MIDLEMMESPEKRNDPGVEQESAIMVYGSAEKDHVSEGTVEIKTRDIINKNM